jgi:CheY-like chemotaxis protein/signal transduction histidine kinase
MKMAKKFLLNIAVASLLLGTIFIAFIIFGVNPLAKELESELETEEIQPQVNYKEISSVTKREETIKNIVLFAVPLLGLIYIIYSWAYISRNIIKPLTRAVDFSNQLANGNFPKKLQLQSTSDEIITLTKALNYLCDRLHNTIMKLDKSHKREKDARLGAEKASNLKSNFLSRLSPELRTPLNAINGYVEIIRSDLSKGCYDRLLQERIENIARNAETLNRQVANLLDIGKLGGEDKYLNITEFNTGDFMRELLEYNVFCLQEKDITLVNHLSSGVAEKINTDRNVLSLILSTLIRAIARVSRPGEIISCGCEPIDDKLVFWIRDNRKSEPLEHLAPLFRKMIPDSDFSTTASPAVLNMMLAATKASSLGAELNAETHEEAACEFTLTFHAWDIISENSVQESSLRIISNKTSDNTFEEHDEDLEVMTGFKLEAELYSKNLRILLAEDDKDNAHILKTLLTSDGHKVKVVENGTDCAKVLAEEETDLLLLSFFLPETDVFEFIEELRKSKTRQSLPILILTGYLSQYDRQRLIIAGVNRCFIKPLNFELLRQVIQTSAKK